MLIVVFTAEILTSRWVSIDELNAANPVVSPIVTWDEPDTTPLDTKLIVLVAESIEVEIPPPSPFTLSVSVLRSILSVPESPATSKVWLNPDTVDAIEADKLAISASKWVSIDELNDV